MSHLEQWIAEFARRGDVSLDAPLKLLKQHPSLPWLQLTQYGFAAGSTRVSLQTSFRHVRFDLENWHPEPVDLEILQNFPGNWEDSALGRALKLLLHYKPTALSISWQAGGQSGAWVMRAGAPRQTYTAPQRRVDALMVHVSWKPAAVSSWRTLEKRHAALLAEYVKRTHFAPQPILMQGRVQSSDLELSIVQSRSHLVTAVMAEPKDDAIACAPPIIYNPYEVELNGQSLYSSAQVSEGLRGRSRVARYRLLSERAFESVHYDCGEVNLSRLNLEHPELLVAYDMHEAPRSFRRLALRGTQAYLLPMRRVGPAWMVRYSIRPFRVSRLFCVPREARPGTGFLLPVHHGVCLSPIVLNGVAQGTLVVATCPNSLKYDDTGLQLQADPALSRWQEQIQREVLEHSVQ
ncbi:MAG: hypothetical protein J0I12_14605 [Candidatus Eremiobacteraeota bacterium]|nr:hypothetical protein [Candidatus Eremiobacteraeota bacterium]